MKLPSYIMHLKHADPSGIYFLRLPLCQYSKELSASLDQTEFLREFCTYAIMPSYIKKFFDHSRKIMCWDCHHLTGKFDGVHYIAAMNDANEQVMPLMIARLGTENKNGWRLFQEILENYLGNITLVISDEDKGLEESARITNSRTMTNNENGFIGFSFVIYFLLLFIY